MSKPKQFDFLMDVFVLACTSFGGPQVHHALFIKKLVNEKGTGALQVYTSELDHTAGGASPDVLMQDRLKKGKERRCHNTWNQ